MPPCLPRLARPSAEFQGGGFGPDVCVRHLERVLVWLTRHGPSVFSKFGDHACPLLLSCMIAVIKNCVLRKLAARVQGNKNVLYFLGALGC